MALNKANRRFTQLNVIFLAMLAGQIIFAIVTYFLIQGGTFGGVSIFGEDQDLTYLTLYALAMMAGAYFMDQFRAKTTAKQDQRERSSEEKFSSYYATVLIRLAILEAANLLLIVSALLTGNVLLLAIAIGVMAVFYFFRPREEEFAERYGR